MTDALLDEEYIKQLLASTPTTDPESIGRLQAGALQALVDMYDRKSTREAFMHHAAAAVALYGQASKLWMLTNIKIAFDSGDLDHARFMEAQNGLIELLRKQAATVGSIVALLQQCPSNEDRVH